MKKRILIMLLALLVVVMFAFVACKEESDDSGDDTPDTSTSTDTSTDTATDTNTGCAHTWDEGVVTKEPTCRADGVKTFTCSSCQGTRTEKIARGDEYHTFSDEAELVDHDCAKGEGGKYVYKCTVCGDPNPDADQTNVDLADLLDPAIVEVPATCTAPGYSFSKCTICFNQDEFDNGSFKGVVNYAPIGALGHQMEVVNSTSATCTTPEILDKECTREGCDYEETGVPGKPATGHDYTDQPTLTKQPTCDENGYYYKECKHCPGDETAYEFQGSDASLVSKGHTIDINDPEYTIVTPATCVTNGTIVPICKVCNVEVPEKTEIDYATNDHFITYEVVGEPVAASCHNDAYEVRRCTGDVNCGKEEKFYEEGTKKEHNFVQYGEPVAPTCQEEGYTIEICTECNTANALTCEDGCNRHTNFVETVPHAFTTIVPNSFVDATCTKPAYVEYTCGFCNGTYEYKYPTEDAQDLPEVDGKTFIPLIAHDASVEANWGKSDERTFATCTEEGFTKFYCMLDPSCDEYIEKEVTIRAQHAFTVYEDGRLVCSTCKVTYRDITTYNSTPIASSKDPDKGPLTFTDEQGNEITLSWDVIGYGKPDTTNNKVTANTAYTKGDFELSMAGGVVAIKLADGMETTITVKDSQGNDITYTFTAAQNETYYNVIITRDDGENVVKSNYDVNEFTVVHGDTLYVDLYAASDVSEITVLTNVDTEVGLYSKQ